MKAREARAGEQGRAGAEFPDLLGRGPCGDLQIEVHASFLPGTPALSPCPSTPPGCLAGFEEVLGQAPTGGFGTPGVPFCQGLVVGTEMSQRAGGV